MTAARPLPVLRDDYRHAVPDAGRDEVPRLLQQASDALNYAVLTSAGDVGGDHGDRMRRAEQAREFLLEACKALGRARVYLPKLRNLSPSVVLAHEGRSTAELARIHAAATRLLWLNHAYLPTRSEAKPLPPDEEAQLAVVVAGVTRSARIDRALRHRWSTVALLVATIAMLTGAPLLGAVVSAVGTGIVLYRLWRGDDHHAPTPDMA